MRAVIKSISTLIVISLVVLTSSCSQVDINKPIRATLFLLDASKSTLQSVGIREQQLRERLAGAFSKEEAIYFDFVRNNYTKQIILPLVPMQVIVNVRDIILVGINNERRQDEALFEVSKLWNQSISDSRTVNLCIQQDAAKLELETVLDGQESIEIARNLCVYAEKAKETLSDIRKISSGLAIENAYIGSDIEGAFLRGLAKLESEAFNLVNRDNSDVKVRASIVISSDMMQRGSDGRTVLEKIRNLSEEDIADFVLQNLGEQEFTSFRPVVKVDGWLNTKKNFSEKERESLEMYWKKWFDVFGLNEPDFDLGVLDWSVDS